MNAYKTELFSKYKEILADNKYFSLRNEARNKYVAPAQTSVTPLVPHQADIFSVTKKFTTAKYSCTHPNTYSSNEEYLIGGVKWGIAVQTFRSVNYHPDSISIYIKCSSDEISEWESSTDCQVRLISSNVGKYPNELLSKLPTNRLTFRPSCTKSTCCLSKDMYSTSSDWLSAYAPNQMYTVEVYFKCIHVKGKKAVK